MKAELPRCLKVWALEIGERGQSLIKAVPISHNLRNSLFTFTLDKSGVTISMARFIINTN